MRRIVASLMVSLCALSCGDSTDGEPPHVPSVFCELVADGTSCDDGDACTRVDQCRRGECVGGDSISCDASDDCHLAGSCDPATGVCSNPQKRNGARCDDQNACTQVDGCRAGICVGTSPVVCRQLDLCRAVGICNPESGVCSHPVAQDGLRCDDGDPCTEVDACRAGICIGTQPRECGDEDECGGAGTCDAATGQCVRDLAPDGTQCDDGDQCSVEDTCRRGACAPGRPLSCVSNDPCRVATGCAPDTGCSFTDHPDGAPCNDGDACTSDDHCLAGTCTSTRTVICAAISQCHDTGSCDRAAGCTHPPKPDGTACDDGEFCTILAACVGAVCTASVTVQCPLSRSDCLADGVCDPSDGICFHPTVSDGVLCDDGSRCTGSDRCEVGVCVGSQKPGPPPCSDGICFTAVTATVGITFSSTASSMMGAGAAFFDLDSDGLLDIALGSEGRGVRIYANRGGVFADVTQAVGVIPLSPADSFMGFAVADHDNDGDDDLYLAVRGANRLYRNDSGRLVDVTTLAGVGDPRWSAGASFGDYDSDGDLDLYVGNYIQTPNFPVHTGYPNSLYRNDGDGTFTEISAALGVAGSGTTLAVTWTDFDGDGDSDLFVCNDFGAFVEPNQLYRNDGGTFVEIGRSIGFDIGIFCMGIAASDHDGDLDLDYYFTNLGRNVFLRNDGPAGFVDVTVPTGTGLTFDRCRAPLLMSSWGVGFHDFDNDGVEELYVSNGHVPAEGPIANAEDSSNSLLRSGAPFVDISASAGIDDQQVGRGVAFGDYDNDGDIDILQANVIGEAVLLRNDSPATGAYLMIDLEGRRANRDGFGARVTATTGTISRIREVNANYGFESASDPRVHFGTGAVTVVDELRIRWPSGVVQQVFDVPTGMVLAAIEPLVTATITASPGRAQPGETIDVTARLTNHSGRSLSIAHGLDLVTSLTSTSASGGHVTIAPSSTLMVTSSIVVPAMAAAGQAHVTLSVSEAGAVTQSRRPVQIVP